MTTFTPPSSPPSAPSGTGAAVVHHERRLRRPAPQPYPVAQAEAAAPLARAAGALVQRVLLEQHRVELLEDLHRGRLRDADGGAPVGDAVAGRGAAVAAAGDDVHHVRAIALRVVAAEREVAAGAGGCAEELLRDGRGQRVEHRLGDALAHLRRAARDRARVLGRGGRCRLGSAMCSGSNMPGVDRHVGEDVADREVDRRTWWSPPRCSSAPAQGGLECDMSK